MSFAYVRVAGWPCHFARQFAAVSRARVCGRRPRFVILIECARFCRGVGAKSSAGQIAVKAGDRALIRDVRI
eukprot:2547766-Pleurochrysis_carterae.AAC.1